MFLSCYFGKLKHIFNFHLLFEQPVCQICTFISLQNISTDELIQRDVIFFKYLSCLDSFCQDTYTKSSSECSNDSWFFIIINIAQFSVKAGNL